MSLSSSVRRNNYTGTGLVSVYAYTFKVFAQADLVVKVQKISDGTVTTLTLTTDYTVSGVGATSGGNITLVNASQAWLTAGKLSSTYNLMVRRVVDIVQNTDVRNQGEFYASIHEDEFDKLTMIDQQQQDQLDRSLQLPDVIDPDDFDTELPSDIADHPNEAIIVNGDGDGFEFREVASGYTYYIQATAPTSPSASSIAFWYDTSQDQLKIWKRTAWATIA